MRRYLDPSAPTPSGRYGLALTPVLRTEPRTVREAPLEPAAAAALQTWTEPRPVTPLAAYQYPTSRIHCCPTPAPIAPSDATEWVR
jgi:hypothetical protein